MALTVTRPNLITGPAGKPVTYELDFTGDEEQSGWGWKGSAPACANVVCDAVLDEDRVDFDTTVHWNGRVTLTCNYCGHEEVMEGEA